MLQRTMQAHLGARDVQLSGFALLRSLAESRDCRRSIFQADALATVVASMNEHQQDADLQVEASGVLWSLSFAPEFLPKLMDSFQAIHAAMRQCAANESLQTIGCALLRRLAGQQGLSQRLCRLGALDLVLHAMEAHCHSAKVQREACATIASLAAAESGSRWERVDDATRAVLEAMRNLRGCSRVQHDGCVTLRNLQLVGGGDQCTSSWASVADSARALVGAVQAHPRSRAVQREASEALLVLGAKLEEGQWQADEDGSSESESTRCPDSAASCVSDQRHGKLLASAMLEGALPMVLSLMAANGGSSANLGVQRSACALLREEATSVSCQSRAESIVESVVDVMRSHPMQPEMLRDCCSVLSRLSEGKEGCSVVGILGVSPLLRTMVEHLQEAALISEACLVLQRLAAGADSRSRLMSLGAAKTLLQAMSIHQEAELLCRACRVLLSLAMDVRYRAKLVSIGATDIIQASVRSHPEATDLTLVACSTLRYLDKMVERVAL